MKSGLHSNVVVSPGKEKIVVLSNCQSGIGIKIVGGKTSCGPSYGIFVKKTIPGSPAAKNNCLREGDKILKVNKESVAFVSNERAMSLFLNASKAGVVTMLVERSESSQREYLDLIGTLTNGLSSPSMHRDKYPWTESFENSVKASPATINKRSWILAEGRMSPLSPEPTNPARTSPRAISPDDTASRKFQPTTGMVAKSSYGEESTERPFSQADSDGDSGLHLSSSTLNNLSHLMVANVALTNGLGMSITGGMNHPDGPCVVVKELINGGDVYCNGLIKQGDQIVGINGESFLNVTHEEAKMKFTQLKLRADKEFEITYTTQRIDVAENGFGEENRAIYEQKLHNNVDHTKSLDQIDNTGNYFQQMKEPKVDQNGNENGTQDISPNEGFSSIMGPSVQPSSIPFYLQQDLSASSDFSSTLPNHKHPGKTNGLKRRLSLAPSSKLRVEKLEVALKYLGVDLTSQQQKEIRSKLHVDARGCVSYGEFVKVAQEVLRVELLDCSQMLSPGKLQFAVHDIEKNGLKLDFPAQPPDSAAIEELRKERDEALLQVNNLQKLLDQKKSSHIIEAEQLESIKRTAEEALEESQVLKDQVYVATQAKMAADRKDKEYEEVIKMLEEELHLLKANGTPKQQEFQNLQKKVVVLGCQLRKMEVVKRTYEVATDRLLSFADHVHGCLKKGALSPSSLPSSSSADDRPVLGQNQHPPSYLSQKQTSQKLADEARDIVRGVRTLLEEEPLPFGWEEAYTCDGERYFINHVNQHTTWLHPISHMKKEKTEEV